MVIIVATYLLSAIFTASWMLYTQAGLYIVVGALAVRSSPLGRRTAHVIISAELSGSLIVILADVLIGTDGAKAAFSLWIGLLLLCTVALLIYQILGLPEVTMQSIYGAISTYLVIGLMFSAFYSAMYYLQGRNFFAQGARYQHPSDFQYFSFATLTTLGYGDLTAKLSAGRSVAVIEAMAGQIFLVTLVAKLVAAFRPSAGSQRQPPRGTAPANDHGRKRRA